MNSENSNGSSKSDLLIGLGIGPNDYQCLQVDYFDWLPMLTPVTVVTEWEQIRRNDDGDSVKQQQQNVEPELLDDDMDVVLSNACDALDDAIGAADQVADQTEDQATDQAMDQLLRDIDVQQQHKKKRKINILSDVVVKKASGPTELEKLLTTNISRRKKKTAPQAQSKAEIVVISDDSSQMIPPRPQSPTIKRHGSAYQRNAKRSQERKSACASPQSTCASPQSGPRQKVIHNSQEPGPSNVNNNVSRDAPSSSQPEWGEEFSSSQRDVFSAAFATHKKNLVERERVKRERQKLECDALELERKLAATRAAITHKVAVETKIETKLRVVGEKFKFKDA
jgi:hypothetical protein